MVISGQVKESVSKQGMTHALEREKDKKKVKRKVFKCSKCTFALFVFSEEMKYASTYICSDCYFIPYDSVPIRTYMG